MRFENIIYKVCQTYDSTTKHKLHFFQSTPLNSIHLYLLTGENRYLY